MVTIRTPIQSWSEKENLLAHLPQISNGQSGMDESKNSSEIYQESQSALHIAIPFILAACRQALYIFWQDGHHMVYPQEHLLKDLHFPHTVVSKMFFMIHLDFLLRLFVKQSVWPEVCEYAGSAYVSCSSLMKKKRITLVNCMKWEFEESLQINVNHEDRVARKKENDCYPSQIITKILLDLAHCLENSSFPDSGAMAWISVHNFWLK